MLDNFGTAVDFQYEMSACSVLELEPNIPLIVSADSIPLLRESRLQARAQAEEAIDFNRVLLSAGEDESVPMAVDPLGTASLVLEAERKHGLGSPEYQESLSALRLDTRRLVGEAKRKLTWEDFPVAVQYYDEECGDFLAYGVSLDKLTFNGLSPSPVAEKQQARVEDRVEEKGTYQAIGKLLIGQQVKLELEPELESRAVSKPPVPVSATRFSLCPDWAIAEYKQNPDGGGAYEGMVPEVEKFMIRNIKFDPAKKQRTESQLAVPGLYVDTSVIAEGLGIFDSAFSADSSKDQVNSTVMLTEEDIDEWDWIELLDELASKKHGLDIFMGEVMDLSLGGVKDYQKARAESEQRYAELESDTDILTEEILGLHRAGVDPEVAGGLIEAKLKTLMLEECRAEPSKAREMFNERTAVGFERANRLESVGRLIDATNLRLAVAEKAPAASFCGAGSCGLENVSKSTVESNQKLSELVKDGDIVLKDTARACPECRKMGIVYAYNSREVKKVCTNCDAVDIKKSKV